MVLEGKPDLMPVLKLEKATSNLIEQFLVEIWGSLFRCGRSITFWSLRTSKASHFQQHTTPRVMERLEWLCNVVVCVPTLGVLNLFSLLELRSQLSRTIQLNLASGHENSSESRSFCL